MESYPNCPKCEAEFTYQDGNMFVCPMCDHEWSAEMAEAADDTIKDSNGNPLSDGDSVTIIKDLKVKGSSSAIKQGTKVKNIKLVSDPVDGHDIDCKIDGFGAVTIKSEYVKKVK